MSEKHLYAVAAAMWREQVRDVPRVYTHRTPEAFLEQHVQTRENWKSMARIAIEMCKPEHMNEGGPIKIELADAEERLAMLTKGDGFTSIVALGIMAGTRAMQKYPQPNYVITKVAEEAGKVVKAAVHAAEGRETVENLRGEMIDLIAVLYRLWVEGDQVHGLEPVGKGYSS
jgi:hypothetical protein